MLLPINVYAVALNKNIFNISPHKVVYKLSLTKNVYNLSPNK